MAARPVQQISHSILILRRQRIILDENRSQIVTGFQKHRDSRFPPYGFTATLVEKQ